MDDWIKLFVFSHYHLLQCYYKYCLMHKQSSFSATNIKLTFKSLTRLQPIQEVDYKAFIKSLYYHFTLKPSACYRLFYNNPQQQPVTVRS